MRRRSLPSRLALALLLIVVLEACSGGTSRLTKNEVSSVWVGADSAELTASVLARLKDAGIEEAYLPVARLNARAAQPLERLEIPGLEGGIPVTLSIDGRFNLSDEDEARASSAAVAEQARQLRFDLESQGRLVVGVHFDIRKVDDLASYGVFLAELNGQMDED
ncbi:MAG: hypothetical protein AAF725_20470, partial [Acidobacteriota bacterium]